VGKALSLPKSGESERCFVQVGSGLTRKHETKLDSLDRSKHSSLLRTFINYGRKSFKTLD